MSARVRQGHATTAAHDRDHLTLDADFTGPASSGQGGIAAGLLGRRIDGPARVRLHRPPPLGTRLSVARVEHELQARDAAGDVVLSAAPAAVHEPAVEVPDVSLATARDAVMDLDAHAQVAPYCVVCGPLHPRSLRVFFGPVADHPDVLALAWTAPAWTGDAAGNVRPEMVWGVLDCPGSAAAALGMDVFPALGTYTVAIDRPVPVGTEVRVIAWRRGVDGRKLYWAAAIVGADGTVHARATHLCIALPPDWARRSDPGRA